VKLSISQSTMLRIIANACRDKEFTELIPWYPRSEVYLEDRSLCFSAQSAGPAIKALWRKGLAAPYPKLGEYSSVITELGLVVAEKEKGNPIAFISPMDQQRLRARQGDE
jgi:hypothetical protein